MNKKHTNSAGSSKRTFGSWKMLLPVGLLTLASLAPSFMGMSNHAAEARTVSQAFRMPDTPFLPPYSGRIVSGDVSAKAQPDGGIAYSITFETAEQPAQVLAWYKSAFNQYSWNVDAPESMHYMLSAQHGKNVASNIFLFSPKKAGANVQVQLYYRYVGRDI